jgi:hypothetical protein
MADIVTRPRGLGRQVTGPFRRMEATRLWALPAVPTNTPGLLVWRDTDPAAPFWLGLGFRVWSLGFRV